MAVGIPVFQVVGFKNSGKTTLMLQLTEYFQKQDLKVAVLKHHGHGGSPDLGVDKDSTKYFQSGAHVSLVEGEGVIQLAARMEDVLDKKLQLLQFFEPDVILIEGYKYHSYPKILLLRREEDLLLLNKLHHIIAIVYWPELAANVQLHQTDYRKFKLADKAIFSWLQEEYQKSQSIK